MQTDVLRFYDQSSRAFSQLSYTYLFINLSGSIRHLSWIIFVLYEFD